MYDDVVTIAIASLENRLKQKSEPYSIYSARMENLTQFALISALSLKEDEVIPAIREILSDFWLITKNTSFNYYSVWNEPFTTLLVDAAKIVALHKKATGAKSREETSYIYWLCPGLEINSIKWNRIEKKSSLEKLGYDQGRVYAAKRPSGSGRIGDVLLEEPALITTSIKRFLASDRFKDLLTEWDNVLSDEILTAMVNHALESHYVEHTQILSEYCNTNKRDIRPGVPYLLALLRNHQNLLNSCTLNPDVSVRLTEATLANRYKQFQNYSILEFAIIEICEKNNDEALKDGLAYVDKLIESGAIPNQLTLSLVSKYKKQIFLGLWNRLNTNTELDSFFGNAFPDFICESGQDIRDNIKVINHFSSQKFVDKTALYSFFKKLFATHDPTLYKEYFENWLPRSPRELLVNVALFAAIDVNESDILNLLLNKGAALNQRWSEQEKTIIFRCKDKPKCLSAIASWVKGNQPKFFYAPPADLEEFLLDMIKMKKGSQIIDFIGVGIKWTIPSYKEKKNSYGWTGSYKSNSLLLSAFKINDLQTFKALVACGYPIDFGMSGILRRQAAVKFGERFCDNELKLYTDTINNPPLVTVSDKRVSLFGKKNNVAEVVIESAAFGPAKTL